MCVQWHFQVDNKEHCMIQDGKAKYSLNVQDRTSDQDVKLDDAYVVVNHPPCEDSENDIHVEPRSAHEEHNNDLA